MIKDFGFIFEQMTVGVGLRDIDGTILYLNDAYKNFTCLKDEKNLLGRNIKEFIGEEKFNKLNLALLQSADNSHQEDLYITTSNGVKSWARVILFLKDIDGRKLVLAFINKTEKFDKDVKESLGRFKSKLVFHRKTAGITQLALAKEIGLSERQLQRLEAGDSKPTFEHILKLSKAFEIPVEELY